MSAADESRTLFEALSAITLEGKSGRLNVEHWDKKEGIIGLSNGKIVHCRYQSQTGIDALSTISKWISVSIRFFEGVESIDHNIHEDTASILAGLSRQEKDIRRLSELIPGPQTIFILSPDSPEENISLSRGVWRVLALIDGRNSVKDVCRILNASELSVSKAIYYLYGRKFLRIAALDRPMEATQRDFFFEQMSETLMRHIGPIAPLIIDDALETMGKTREYINQDDLPLLVELMGENFDEEDERVDFQKRMLDLIRQIGAKGK